LRELRDALGGYDGVKLGDIQEGSDQLGVEMNFDAEIKLNSEIYLQAAIMLIWRCIWRPRLGNMRDEL